MDNKDFNIFIQFGYAIRGIVQPKYFNRLAYQKKVKTIFYGIVLAMVATAAFWGLEYFILYNSSGLKSFVNGFPAFSYYTGGHLEVNDSFHKKSKDGKWEIYANTEVTDAGNCDTGALKTAVDWKTGTSTLVVLTGNGYIVYDNKTGMESVYKYVGIENAVSKIIAFPAILTKDNLLKMIRLNLLKAVIVLGIATFVINALIGLTVVPLLYALIGFGLMKLLHGDFRYKELYAIAVFIYGVVSVMLSLLMLTPIPKFIVGIVGLLGMGAYYYFALTGSRTETGFASSIDLNKKEKKFQEDLGFMGTGFPAPDPFENRSKPASRFKRKEAPATETYQAEPLTAQASVQDSYVVPSAPEPYYDPQPEEEPELSQTDLVFGSLAGSVISTGSTIGGSSIGGSTLGGSTLGGSTFGNSGGGYTGGGYDAGSYVSRGTSNHIGGYHDPAYDMPQVADIGYASDPLPKLDGSYGGTFSAGDLDGSMVGGSTFAGSGQSTFGSPAFGGSTFGSSFGSSAFAGGASDSAFGSSTFGSSAFGGSTYGSAYGGNSYGNSVYGGNRFSRPKDEPLLRSTGSGSAADKDFEEWERQHYGNK